MDHPTPLWRSSADRIERAAITRYLGWLKANRGLEFEDYETLWHWSVTEIEAFWESIWQFFGVRSHSPYARVLDGRRMPGAQWFEGSTLNYAAHALAGASRTDAATRPALVCRSETRSRGELSWSQLATQVGALAATLEALGIRPGDRVVSYMPNIPESVVALLATASCGGIWSSCSPDMGPVSVLDRFRQIEPKVLFAVDGYRYGGKDYDRRDVVRELVAQLPTLEAVVFVPYLDPGAWLEGDTARHVRVLPFAEAIAQAAAFRPRPLPFDHPLWIVYSSGTTGMPKPIVHGHGGTVIETAKGTGLALDVGEDDRFFWFSSTSCIMWNVLVSALTRGATILQFDVWPGVWRHGDWLKLIPRPESVTAVIYGRSDSTINRHGIRMGTSELYRVVEGFAEVADSLVVDLEYLGRPSFMALFVVLREPRAEVPPTLEQSILHAIRTGLSARHVPDDVFAIAEVPRTISGKKMEVPVKKILLGHPVEQAANRDAMANPESLDWFVAFAKAREAAT